MKTIPYPSTPMLDQVAMGLPGGASPETALVELQELKALAGLACDIVQTMREVDKEGDCLHHAWFIKKYESIVR